MGDAAMKDRTRLKAKRKLEKQLKKANMRAKYGPKMKPAPVTVRSMVDFEIVEIVDQSEFTR
jgi:hypothetical protein